MQKSALLSKNVCCLSGSVLKTLAVISMLIDHVASAFLRQTPIILFTVRSDSVTLFGIMRSIGRLAFPLFSFLLVEGFLHTHSRPKYGLNLFLFALISEIPWDLEHTGMFVNHQSQNVFFTLFFGYLGLCILERYQSDWKKMLLLLSILLLITRYFFADYSVRGFAFILLLYVLREQKVIQAVIGASFFIDLSVLAFIPINLYNGKRGFIHGNVLKYLFYTIYPAHMLLFYFIKAHTLGY